MQKTKDYPLELVFGEGKLQDFVFLNQVPKSRPDG